nr:protein YhfH [Pontibacillus litoralis]
MMNVMEFFKSLPKKKCTKCNNAIQEQADCYGNICEECDHPAR